MSGWWGGGPLYRKTFLESEIIRLARERHIDTRALTGGSVLASTEPTAEGRALARVIQELRRAMNDELLGMTRRPIPAGTFDFVVKSALHGRTLGEVLLELIAGAEVVYSPPNLRAGLETRGDTAVITLRNEHAPDDLVFLTWGFMATHRGISWLIDERVVLRGLELHGRDATKLDDLRYIFQCEVALRRPANAILFHRDYLDAPVRRSLTEVNEFLERRPLDVLYVTGVDRSTSTRVRTLLRHHLDAGEGLPAAERIADAVGITEAALRRRLAREGQKVQALKNEIRYEAAMQKLERTTLPIDRVAEALGFRETNSFYRAFKRWSGKSPQAYRADSRRQAV